MILLNLDHIDLNIYECSNTWNFSIFESSNFPFSKVVIMKIYLYLLATYNGYICGNGIVNHCLICFR